MQYKTTYFTLSNNKEISIYVGEFNYRTDRKKLEADIKLAEGESIDYKGKSLAKLEEILKKQSGYSRDLRNLIRLKRMLENFDNKRFTEQDNTLLNEHISTIASEGWKLTSMQPILKGLYDYCGTDGHAYGYGHNVTEGFVIVWEKI